MPSIEAEVDRLYDGTLNRVRCPSCDARAEVQLPIVYHDGEQQRLVLVLPDGLRHRELHERAALFAQLAADGVAPPAYVLEPAVVFGPAGLRALRRRGGRTRPSMRGRNLRRSPCRSPSRRRSSPTARATAPRAGPGVRRWRFCHR